MAVDAGTQGSPPRQRPRTEDALPRAQHHHMVCDTDLRRRVSAAATAHLASPIKAIAHGSVAITGAYAAFLHATITTALIRSTTVPDRVRTLRRPAPPLATATTICAIVPAPP